MPSNWGLAWGYGSCPLGVGIFSVSIYDSTGQNSTLDLENQGVSEDGTAGAGTRRYHSGGNKKFLNVTSSCKWNVTVFTDG